jgi:transcriptional antiterminator
MQALTNQPSNKTKLAAFFGVSRRTVYTWLKKMHMEKPRNGGYIYTAEEVKSIISKIGE